MAKKSGEVVIALSAETTAFDTKVAKSGNELDKFKGKVNASKSPLSGMKANLESSSKGAEMLQKVFTGGAFVGAFGAAFGLVSAGLNAIATMNDEAAAKVNRFVDGILGQITKQKTAYKELQDIIRKTNQEAALILAGDKREELSEKIALENQIRAAKERGDAELATAKAERAQLLADAESKKKAYSGNNPFAQAADAAFGPNESERLRAYASELKTIAAQTEKTEKGIKDRIAAEIAAAKKLADLNRTARDQKSLTDKKTAEDKARADDLKATQEHYKRIGDIAAASRDEWLRANGQGDQADRESTDRRKSEVYDRHNMTDPKSRAMALQEADAIERAFASKQALNLKQQRLDLKALEDGARQERLDSRKSYLQQIEDLNADAADKSLRRQGKVLEAETAAIQRETAKQQRAVLDAALNKTKGLSILGNAQELAQAQGLIQAMGKVRDEKLRDLSTAKLGGLPTAVERRFDLRAPSADQGPQDPQTKALNAILKQLQGDKTGKAAVDLLAKMSKQTLKVVGL